MKMHYRKWALVRNEPATAVGVVAAGRRELQIYEIQ